MPAPDLAVPDNKFTPRLLDVDVPDNLAGVFANARRISSGTHPDFLSSEKRVAILTPGRAIITIPALPKEQVLPKTLSAVEAFLGSKSRDIIVISWTRLDALMEDERGKLQCIPFLPQLCTFAAAGHTVVVFEGHPSALEAGLLDTDVLVVDSAMVPFLQPDWLKLAASVMRAGARYFIYGREKQDLREVRLPSQPAEFQHNAPGGEASYAHCLLTILGKRSGSSVSLDTNGKVPDLRMLTHDPADAAWVAAFPFQYERLDTATVMRIILKFAGVENDGPRLIPGLKSRYTLNARLAQSAGSSSFCPFRLILSGFGSRKHLEIVRENF
jgi:hypothetical protein